MFLFNRLPAPGGGGILYYGFSGSKEKLIDPRHIKICIVCNDPLGKAFNVKTFHKCQVIQLLRRNIIPLD